MSKRQKMREKRRRQQRIQRMVAIGIIVLGALLVTLVLILPNLGIFTGAIATVESNPRPMALENAMGDPNAPVKIYEYSDFQCPACARFWIETEPKIVENYVKTGKVYFVSRSLGNMISEMINQQLGTDNTESRDSAAAAYCAGDQGKYWGYHDILFANQTGEGVGDFSEERLIAYAKELGLNMSDFKSCFNSGKYHERVAQDGVDGQAAGVHASPSFIINGQLLVGAQPFEVFQQAIEAALAGQ